MSCNCEKTGKGDLAQCLSCAKKHISIAVTAWGEFQHADENRLFVSSNLRLAAQHIYVNYAGFAERLRRLAKVIEENADPARTFVRFALRHEQEEIVRLWNEENPKRRMAIDAYNHGDPMPLIVPVGTGSKNNNDELRILLRSIAENVSGVSQVVIVTQALPEWVRNVVHIQMDDSTENCKDANIIRKVYTALEVLDIKRHFVRCSDDQVFWKPSDLRTIPVVTGSTNMDWAKEHGCAKWVNRFNRTKELLEKEKLPVRNYDAHCPQRHYAPLIRARKNAVDWETAPGYTIETLFYFLERYTGDVKELGEEKTTCYSETWNKPFNTRYVGYTDAPFGEGLREKLFERFPDKCRFEA